MPEEVPLARPGDRIRVTGSGLIFSGTLLAVRPDGLYLCLLDNTDRAQAVDPNDCLIEVVERCTGEPEELLMLDHAPAKGRPNRRG